MQALLFYHRDHPIPSKRRANDCIIGQNRALLVRIPGRSRMEPQISQISQILQISQIPQIPQILPSPLMSPIATEDERICVDQCESVQSV